MQWEAIGARMNPVNIPSEYPINIPIYVEK